MQTNIDYLVHNFRTRFDQEIIITAYTWPKREICIDDIFKNLISTNECKV